MWRLVRVVTWFLFSRAVFSVVGLPANISQTVSNAPLRINYCTSAQRDAITLAFASTALSLSNAVVAITAGTGDTRYLAMFKERRNRPIIMNTIRSIINLDPLPRGEEFITPQFICIQPDSHPSPAMLECLELPAGTETFAYIAEMVVIICPHFFQSPIAPIKDECPALWLNAFVLNAERGAFGSAQNVDLIYSLLSVYVGQPARDMGPPHLAIAVLNEAMRLKSPACANDWRTLAGFVLRKWVHHSH